MTEVYGEISRTMVIVGCPIDGCPYQMEDSEVAVVAALLNLHAAAHNNASAIGPSTKQKPPKLVRPSLARGTSEEEWQTFQRKWMIFKDATSIPREQLTTQLWQCCDNELVADLFRDISNIATINEAELLQAMMKLAAICSNQCQKD